MSVNPSHRELAALIQQGIDASILAETSSRVERHEHILFGDGTDGLVVRFNDLHNNLTKDLTLVTTQLTQLNEQLLPLLEWKNTVVVRVAGIVAAASAVSAVLGGIVGVVVTNYDKASSVLQTIAPLVSK